MLEALSDSLVLGMSNLLIEDLSLRVIFPRLLLRQRLLHSTITVTDISIATVAIITETVIPAITADPWLAACRGITLVGEGETLIGSTMAVPGWSEETPVVGEGERLTGGTMAVASCSEETPGLADGETEVLEMGSRISVHMLGGTVLVI